MNARLLLLLLALLAPGCATEWHEVPNGAGDRLWLISHDRTVILRCYDGTPDAKPLSSQKGRNIPLEVVCQEATIRGAENPFQ